MKKLLTVVAALVLVPFVLGAQGATSSPDYGVFNRAFTPNTLFLCRKFTCRKQSLDRESDLWWVKSGGSRDGILIVQPQRVKSLTITLTRGYALSHADLNEQFNKILGVKKERVKACISRDAPVESPFEEYSRRGVVFSCFAFTDENGQPFLSFVVKAN